MLLYSVEGRFWYMDDRLLLDIVMRTAYRYSGESFFLDKLMRTAFGFSGESC